MEEILSSWLHAARGRPFLLVIIGRISGVHGWEKTHRPIACHMEDSKLTIEFDGAECLTILNATDITLLPNGELVVSDADEARISWYAHRDSQTTPSLCEEVFTKVGSDFEFSRTGASFATSGSFFAGYQFIVLRPAQGD